MPELAEILLNARANRRPVREVPVPATLVEAYAVQDAMAAAVGEIGGWKIGAASPSDVPLFAPMPRAWMRNPPVQSRLRGVEVEIAFQLRRDLPARDKAYSRDEVMGAVATANPAIEVIESALADPDAVPRFLKIADLQIHGGFIAGPPISDWQSLDWLKEVATLRVNGSVYKQSSGSSSVEERLRLLVYLANEGSARTGGLRAGQWITTGSWTGVDYCARGDIAQGQFTHSDGVQVSFE